MLQVFHGFSKSLVIEQAKDSSHQESETDEESNVLQQQVLFQFLFCFRFKTFSFVNKRIFPLPNFSFSHHFLRFGLCCNHKKKKTI